MATTKIEIMEQVIDVVKKELERAMSKEFDLAIEEFNRKKREIIAGILIGVMKTVEIETLKDRIIFTIREIKKD